MSFLIDAGKRYLEYDIETADPGPGPGFVICCV